MTDDVRAPERLRVLRRNATRWILALSLLVVALLVGVSWSLGLFGSSSTNASNVVTAGSMRQINSAENAAIMGASDLVPGDVVEGTATIQNVGDARGDFTLTVQDLLDEPGPNGGLLSTRLQLEVFEADLAPPIYSGPLAGLDVSLGAWAVDEKRSYRFVATLPEGPDEGADNRYQHSKVTATFEWNAVQGH